MQCIALDVIGPLPVGTNRSTLILSVIDHRTRWAEAYPLRRQTTQEIAQQLVNRWITRYGIPERILTDQGQPFVSKLMNEICDMMGIKHKTTTAYHPEANGICERFNQTIKRMLSMQEKGWYEMLPFVTFAYNTSIHNVTGYTPYRMLFGREARIGSDAILLPPYNHTYASDKTYVQTLEQRMREAHATVDGRIVLQTEKRQEQQPAGMEYLPTQPVWLFVPPRTKQQNPYTGPYQIVDKLGPVTYRIQEMNGKRRKKLVVHASRLKKMYERDSSLIYDESNLDRSQATEPDLDTAESDELEEGELTEEEWNSWHSMNEIVDSDHPID